MSKERLSTRNDPQALESGWQVVNPPITQDKKIRTSDAVRGSRRLLDALSRLNISTTETNLEVFNGAAIDWKTTPLDKTLTSYKIRFNGILLDIPTSVLPTPSNSQIIREGSGKWTNNNVSSLDADIVYDGQQIRLLMFREPVGEFPYDLYLVMPIAFPPDREVLLDSIPIDLTSVGFSYDFFGNPELRDRLSGLAEKRVDMDMVNGDPEKKSRLFGRQTPNGINAVSILHLQSPNPFSHLKCYEIELFGEEVRQGRERSLANTEEIVPESKWQEEERHFCMTGDKETLTYPLLPIKELGKISTLSMEVHFDDKLDDPRRVHKLFQGFPLSVDGTNQWYATGHLGEGNVELLFKPEWGEDNTKLVYRKSSSKRISPKEIHHAVAGLARFKKSLTERLAA